MICVHFKWLKTDVYILHWNIHIYVAGMLGRMVVLYWYGFVKFMCLGDINLKINITFFSSQEAESYQVRLQFLCRENVYGVAI